MAQREIKTDDIGDLDMIKEYHKVIIDSMAISRRKELLRMALIEKFGSYDKIDAGDFFVIMHHNPLNGTIDAYISKKATGKLEYKK